MHNEPAKCSARFFCFLFFPLLFFFWERFWALAWIDPIDSSSPALDAVHVISFSWLGWVSGKSRLLPTYHLVAFGMK
ncbi:hypothetical protein GGR50DRAFT_664888 [Xylaria sp. CBS 124048]|nr:hypothetical protein GGR50DRAFT_664888 [Xylaria sp. CBS 124048]